MQLYVNKLPSHHFFQGIVCTLSSTPNNYLRYLYLDKNIKYPAINLIIFKKNYLF